MLMMFIESNAMHTREGEGGRAGQLLCLGDLEVGVVWGGLQVF